ncbi:MAG: response regulator [Pseudobdellovibrio sp.]
MHNILLCDDSNMILTLLDKRLRDAGFNIVGKAKDGDECIKLYNEIKPDLLLLDITMPNKDGRECLSDLIKSSPLAKIIMISALADQAIHDECINLGAKAFISKSNLSTPDDFEKKVLTIIRNVLK